MGGTGNLRRHRNRREDRSGPFVGRSRPFEGRSSGFEGQHRERLPHTRPRLGHGSEFERGSHHPVDASGCAASRRGHTLIPRKSQTYSLYVRPGAALPRRGLHSAPYNVPADRLVCASMRRDPVESARWLSILAPPASVGLA